MKCSCPESSNRYTPTYATPTSTKAPKLISYSVSFIAAKHNHSSDPSKWSTNPNMVLAYSTSKIFKIAKSIGPLNPFFCRMQGLQDPPSIFLTEIIHSDHATIIGSWYFGLLILQSTDLMWHAGSITPLALHVHYDENKANGTARGWGRHEAPCLWLHTRNKNGGSGRREERSASYLRVVIGNDESPDTPNALPSTRQLSLPT